MSMTPRERAVAALQGRTPDRVPCVPLIDTSYAAAVAGIPVGECFINPEAYAAALVATFDRHPDVDGVTINIGLSDDVMLDHRQVNGVHTIRTTGGLTWMVPENDIGSIEHCEITRLDDPRFDTDEYLMPACLRTLGAIPKAIRDKYLINTTVTGPYSQVAFLIGVNNLMLATLDEPDELEAAIRRRVPFALKWVDELAALEPGCVWIGEGFASNSLVGRDTYRRFVMPYERAVVERIHAIGKTALLHICGQLDSSLESLPETGTDGAEIDWQVDIPDAKQRVGDRMTLKGNLNTSTLVHAGFDEIYALTRDVIRQGKPGGRFILSSGCCLGRDTPATNVDAMVRACEDFGAYPDPA
ncbi:MAG: uroporphyrinogen decarboxylase family protein [Kiritimatiellia bacterium]